MRRHTTAAAAALVALSSAACSTAHTSSEQSGTHSASTPADPSIAASPTGGSAGGPEPTILFQRTGSRRAVVGWVAADGTGEAIPLAEFGDGPQTNPDWSPDGSRIVFVMRDGSTDDLFVADSGAPEAHKLLDCVAPCLFLDDPAWSPDGDLIAFSREADRDGVAVGTLETVDVTTGRSRVLLGPLAGHGTAGVAWSPDGRELVFELIDIAGPDVDAEVTGVSLTTYDLRTHTTSRITDRSRFAATATWSPDGRWIVYSGPAEPGAEATELFRVRPSGGRPHQLTHLADQGGYAAEPTYAPDGRIVFSGGRTADERELLLQLVGRTVSSATGGVVVSGRHPRVKGTES